MPWPTVSNAFEKSRYSMSTEPLPSSVCMMSSKTFNKADKQDRPLLNPCCVLFRKPFLSITISSECGFVEGCIPDDWRKSILVPVYKGKGDPLVCGSYRAIKLLEQQMKVPERVLEKRIRCQVSIDNMQFGFMPGKGTTDAIFIM